MEPSWDARAMRRIPLLPFERQLIEALGCSKEEYELFVEELRKKSKERPAEYAHIPDIQNVEWVALGLTIIGIGFQVASYLMAPKPREIQRRDRAAGIQIGAEDVRGPSRFSPTTGFDSLQELASYGDAIPIIFTKREEGEGIESSGGILTIPKLVWSRVISMGSHQIIEQQFILGQGPIDASFSGSANATGIFLGNNTLDVSSPDSYALYFRDGSSTDNRMGAEHLLSGTLETAEPFPFRAPTSAGELTGAKTVTEAGYREPWAFCSSFTPSNKTQFGIYSGIPNGTSIRLPWEIISVAFDVDKIDESAFNRRKWISGVQAVRKSNAVFDFYMGDGMNGTGMNYARRCGVLGVGSTGISEVSGLSTGKYKIYEADIGAEIDVTIGMPSQQDLVFEPVFDEEDTTNNGQDLRNALENEHAQADDAMRIGDEFIIGTGLWRVKARKLVGAKDGEPTIWSPGRQMLVTLKCIKSLAGFGMGGSEIFTKARFGKPEVAALEINPAIGRCLTSDDDFDASNGMITGEGITRTDYVLPETFFPICKAAIATFENTRQCDVTEIGIRSQVWTRLNSLTNFVKLPSPQKLYESDLKNNSYGTGTVVSYERRVSLFSIDIRKAGSLPDDKWTPVGETFAVVGKSPVDQFNYIRIYHPQKCALEYRIRPRNSSEFFYLTNNPNFEVVVLDAGQPSLVQWKAPATVPGLATPVTVLVSGRKEKLRSLTSVQRLSNEYSYTERTASKEIEAVKYLGYRYRPGTSGTSGTSPSVDELSDALRFLIAYRVYYGADINTSPPMDITSTALGPSGVSGKDAWEKANPINFKNGFAIHAIEKYRPGSTKEATFDFTIIAERGATARWTLGRADVTASASNFAVGETLFKGLILGYVPGTSTFLSPVLELIYEVTSLKSTILIGSERLVNRSFESNTAIAEVSHYPSQISRSCDDGPEHSIVYVNESLAEYGSDAIDTSGRFSRCATLGLKLKSSPSLSQLDQLRVYFKNGIKTTNLLSASGPIASSNLFTDLAYYLMTNKETGVGDLVDGLVDTDQMIVTSVFLKKNRLYYSDALTQQTNLRTFLAQIAPAMLCNLVIRNGRFSIEPALPINADGSINTNVVPFSAMFTSGNIVDNTFSVEYLPAEERQDFVAVVRYRSERVNQFPESRAIIVKYTPTALGSTIEPPIEEFDLGFITSKEHAILVGKYYLSLRKRITHTITFKTSPFGIALTPGAYIRVVTQSNPYTPSNNGIITAERFVVSAKPLITTGEASYDVYAWSKGDDTVKTTRIKVKAESDGTIKCIDGPADCIFAIKEDTTRNNCYIVEGVEIDEDGIVKVTASHFPIDDDGRSVIAREILGLISPNPFAVEEL